MNNNDYIETLHSIRSQVRDLRLGALDERIMSNMRGSDGPFWDLQVYLKRLKEEILLGSDDLTAETLRRVQQHAKTEKGGPIDGIRIEFSRDDAQRYGRTELVFSPNKELGGIAEELDLLIDELIRDYEKNRENGGIDG